MTASLPHGFQPGTLIAGRYRVEGLLGQGGLGVVLRATQIPLMRPVAIKVILSGKDADRETVARFQLEAQFAQRLSHPNTVRILDVGAEAAGLPFIVWEFLQGATLADALVSGPMAPDRVRRVAIQVLKSLIEAHGIGIVHRDIKPANIFLCDFVGEPDFVKVLDFGIAKQMADADAAPRLTRPGHVVGTVCYMAPELFLSKPLSPASDLYALGLVMAEALVGEPVVKGYSNDAIMKRHLAEGPHPLPQHVIDGPLGPVIRRAIQKEPSSRYATALEMLEALSQQGQPSAASPPMSPRALRVPTIPERPSPMPLPGLVPSVPTPPRGSRRAGRTRTVLFVVGAGIALVIGAAGGVVGLHYFAPLRSLASAPSASASSTSKEPPVLLDGHVYDGVWTVNILLRDAALDVWYKLPTDRDFTSTGHSTTMRYNGTGPPFAEQYFHGKGFRGRMSVQVKCRDVAGVIKGPYTALLDADAIRLHQAKSTLGGPDSEWIEVRQSRRSPPMGTLEDGWVTFWLLVKQRDGLLAARYSLDSDRLDRSFPISAPNVSSSINVGPLLSYVLVEITYVDGSTDRRRFTDKRPWIH